MTTEMGRDLDDAAAIKRRDPGTMLAKIGAFADQMDAAWKLSRAVEMPPRHRTASSVAVLGMGGSAACGDLVRAIFGDRLTVPIVSIRDYELPAWVGGSTMVVAVSHSGATEETLAALGTALERRCPVAAITTGGPLGEVVGRVGLPRLIYPNETPPRASLGYTMLALAGLLERAGLLPLSDAEVAAAVAAARSVAASCAVDKPTDANLAKQVAWSLLDRLPIIEGSGFLAAVARRWKTQINENANSTATAEELPEATHNTVVGYEQPETLRDHHYVLFLEASDDNPRNRRRARLSHDMLQTVGTSSQRVVFDQGGRFPEACAAISLGDYVSFYLAMLYGVDPSATPALTLVKEALAEFGQSDGDDHESAAGDRESPPFGD